MKKLILWSLALFALSALLAGAASAAVLDDSVIAVWPDFVGLTADSPLPPAYTGSKTLSSRTLDGRNLTFELGGGSVTNDTLYTGTTTAPSISLANKSYSGTEAQATMDIGSSNYPLCYVLAIRGAVSTNVLEKPFVHAGNVSGNTSSGIGMTLRDTSGNVRGAWGNTVWSTDTSVAVPTLLSNQVTYVAFYPSQSASSGSSAGAWVGVVDPEAGTVSWTTLSRSLAGSSITASQIVFGNFINATSGGMNYALAGFALLSGTASSTSTPSDSAILSCVRYMAGEELIWNAGSGSWTTDASATTWLNSTNTSSAVAYEDGSRVVFPDVSGETSSTVTPAMALAPCLVTITNNATAYTLGSDTYAITNSPVILKQGPGSATIVGPNSNTTATRISEVIVEEGTLTAGNNYCLATAPSAANNPVGPKLTVKGGTLDLANTAAYDTSDYSYWLTESTITMGGSATPAVITNAAIVPYSSSTAMNFLTYVGSYSNANNTVEYSPPAVFAASLANVYTTSTRTRTVTVGQGQGTIDPSSDAYTGYDLDLTGGLGTTGEYSGTSLVKAGSGTLRLSCANNLPTLTINAGTVILNDDSAASAAISVASGALIDLGGHACSDSSFSGAGTITNSSSTAVTLLTSQLTAFTGTVESDNITVAIDLGNILEACDLNDQISGFTYNGTIGVANSLPSQFLQYDADSLTVTETFSALPYQITWMPVGDSITEGETYMGQTEDTDARSDGRDGGYRFQLWKALEAHDQDTVSVGFRSGHQGTDEAEDNPDWAWHCGQYGGGIDPMRTANSAANYDVESSFEVAGYPEVITLMLGINDLSFIQYWSGTSVTNVYDSWTNLVTKLATARPLSKVVVSPLFPCISSNVSYSLRPGFNSLMRDAAAAGTAPFDLPNVIFWDVPQIAVNDTFYSGYFKSSDGLHPNRAGSILFGKAFRLGVLEALGSISNSTIAVAQVHNATTGKVTVRFDRPIASIDSATLTITGTDVDANPVSLSLSSPVISSDNARLVEFTLGDGETLIGGSYTATLTDVTLTDQLGATVTAAEIDTSKAILDIAGSGVAENVPADLRSGLIPYQTIAFGDNDNFNGAGPTSGLTQHTNGIGSVTRVGYYLELQRPGQPAQYVWAAMDTTLFGDVTSALGLPTESSGAYKGIVSNLTVYGNHGNFKKRTTGETGIVEITPWTWTASDQSAYPTDAYSGNYGWNDTLETSAGTLKGGFQIFRTTGDEGTPVYGHPRAETLMAINNFNRTNQMDIGIGSFSAMWNNLGSSRATVVYDWTDFCAVTSYTNFYPSAYSVKTLEVWIAPDESVNRWIGGTSTDWHTDSNWSLGHAPADDETAEITLTGDQTLDLSTTATEAVGKLVVLSETADGSTPTLTFSDPSLVNISVLNGTGAALVLTTSATADDPTTFAPQLTGDWSVTLQSGAFTLNDANSYGGSTVIEEPATLVLSTASSTPLGSSATTGSGTVTGSVVSTGLDLTDSAWTGTYVYTGTSLANFSPVSLGNAGSTVEMAGASSGYFASGTLTATAKMKLTGTVTIQNGYSSATMDMGELMGDGTLCFSHANGASQTFSFTDATNFTGTITFASNTQNFRLAIGATASTIKDDSSYYGHLYVGADATINPHANTWAIAKGLDLYGTLTGSGTITLLSGSVSGSGTIALDLDDTLVVKVPTTSSVSSDLTLSAIPSGGYYVDDAVSTEDTYTVHTYTLKPKGLRVIVH